MLQERLARAPRAARLSVRLAANADELRQAQKLRYRIFGEEMGAQLASAQLGIDCDEYDELCDHLVVVSPDGEVVGTYRMLSPDNARRAPKLYSEHEFDLSRLTHVRDSLVEVGRSCVHADYRTGGTIALLWSGLAQYVREHNAEYLAGCASVSLNDGGHQAASLYRKLEASHLAPAEWRVFPHLPLPLARPLLVPLVVLVNMQDEMRQLGIRADLDALSVRLGAPVLAMSARKGENWPAVRAALTRAYGSEQQRTFLMTKLQSLGFVLLGLGLADQLGGVVAAALGRLQGGLGGAQGFVQLQGLGRRLPALVGAAPQGERVVAGALAVDEHRRRAAGGQRGADLVAGQRGLQPQFGLGMDRPAQRDDAAGPDLEVDALEHEDHVAVDDLDIGELEQLRAGARRSRRGRPAAGRGGADRRRRDLEEAATPGGPRRAGLAGRLAGRRCVAHGPGGYF